MTFSKPMSHSEENIPMLSQKPGPQPSAKEAREALNEEGLSHSPPSQSEWIQQESYIRNLSDPYTREQSILKPISARRRPFMPFVEKDTKPASSVYYRPEKKTISIGTIQHWLHACREMHGPRCGEVTYSTSGLRNGPVLLIDAEDCCLVSTPSEVRYIALSYVWGKTAASASTTKDTLPLFKEKGGLAKHTTTLPLVIHQALELVRGLGERYLWVDRFCIVQDEHLQKLRQLNAMGQIYANAYFTLIAAQNEDATQGLYGKRGLTLNERDQPLAEWSEPGPQEVLLQQAHSLMCTKWHSRGWTMQEYLLSRRRVVFHNNTVNWECLCSSWNEMHYLDKKHEQAETSFIGSVACLPDTGLSLEATPWPNMFRYARLVSLYNRRDLTYPEDILDAFAGILTHLSRSFPGGFISGLPQMCFDAALLWQPLVPMTRRTSSKNDTVAQPPSWSWAGWSGHVNSDSWRSAENYMLEVYDEINSHQQCSWKTISTVEWSYIIRGSQDVHQVKVSPEFSAPCLDANPNELPLGWASQPASMPRSGQLYYHKSAPSQPFRYPIPIRDQYKAHIPPRTASLLKCETKHSFLKLGSIYNSTVSGCPAVDLLNNRGEWSGVLRLNCTRSAVDAYIYRIQRQHNGTVELIEISAGEVRNQSIEEKSFDEWNKKECPRHIGLYEFVNVLWIKWNNGVANREALGRVKREVWEEVAKEKIPVVLA